MTTNNGNGGNGGSGRKRITRDDLAKSIEAAKQAAEAAVEVAESTLVALEDGVDDGEVPEARPQTKEAPVAFEEFMTRLKSTLQRAGNSVEVTENAAWIKIESRRNGHKIYVAKGKNVVNRVESTLPPSAVPGATEPGRPNGRIASWIPADVRAVSEAVRVLANSDMTIRPPMRGGGGNRPSGGGGGSQGGPGGQGGGPKRGRLLN